MTLATATSGVAHRSVVQRLSVHGPRMFVSSFSHPGLDLRIGEKCRRGRGVETVIGFLHERHGRDNVVCYVDHGNARGMTRLLRGRKFSMNICRTNVSGRRQRVARSSFVGSQMRVVYTAVTFNVKVSGSGIE